MSYIVKCYAMGNNAHIAFNAATSVSVTNGTISTGNVGTTSTIDNTYFVVQETGQFEIEYMWSAVSGTPLRIKHKGRYVGSAGHQVYLEAWNVSTLAWDRFTAATTDFATATVDSVTYFTFPNTTQYITGGVVRIRIRHNSAATVGHYFYTDYISLFMSNVAMASAAAYTLATYTSTEVMGFAHSAGVFTALKAMNGRISYAVSFGGTADITVEGNMFKNGVNTNIGFTRRLGSAGDVGSASAMGLLSFVAGDTLDLRFSSDTDTSYIGLAHLSIAISEL